MAVRTGVITAAGLGTRFLPVTKTVPKEMLPIIDRPMVQYIVEEAVEAGVCRLVLVTTKDKGIMEDYFDITPELEMALERRGETQQLDMVRRLSRMVEVIAVRQKEQLGLGHAVLAARNAVGDEPFVVYLPDDIIHHPVSATRQMLGVCERYRGSVVAVEEVPRQRISSYGVVDAQLVGDRVYRVRGLVEKPSPAEAPSNLGIVGRYILTPAIFSALERVQPGARGEIQLTDGIALLSQEEPVFAYRFQGRRYDVGQPLGMLQASVELALEREDLGPALRSWLKGLVAKL